MIQSKLTPLKNVIWGRTGHNMGNRFLQVHRKYNQRVQKTWNIKFQQSNKGASSASIVGIYHPKKSSLTRKIQMTNDLKTILFSIFNFQFLGQTTGFKYMESTKWRMWITSMSKHICRHGWFSYTQHQTWAEKGILERNTVIWIHILRTYENNTQLKT